MLGSDARIHKMPKYIVCIETIANRLKCDSELSCCYIEIVSNMRWKPLKMAYIVIVSESKSNGWVWERLAIKIESSTLNCIHPVTIDILERLSIGYAFRRRLIALHVALFEVKKIDKSDDEKYDSLAFWVCWPRHSKKKKLTKICKTCLLRNLHLTYIYRCRFGRKWWLLNFSQTISENVSFGW